MRSICARIRLGCICVGLTMAASSASAITCELTEFRVDAYHHNGLYLHGKLNGTAVDFINTCGMSAGVPDCNQPATTRRLAIALAAEAQGKPLLVYFDAAATCSVPIYTLATSISTSL